MNGAGMFTIEVAGKAGDFDEAQLAAVAFLARYNGRTLDAYPDVPFTPGIDSHALVHHLAIASTTSLQHAADGPETTSSPRSGRSVATR